MRRLLYGVAAVLALAPVAAIAPASAAVQSPAITRCSNGNAPVVTVGNENAHGVFIGNWNVPSTGVVLDSFKHSTEFCWVTIDPNGIYAFREYGTNDCVAYQPSSGLVLMRGCDYSSANQDWHQGANGGFMSAGSDLAQCLEGDGGDTDLYMNTCGAAPDNQFWFIGYV